MSFPALPRPQHRRRLTRVALLAAAMAGAAAGPAAAATPPVTCPATFQVLEAERIGSLRVPAGPYALIVNDTARLSCRSAADAFGQFLTDWDGKLPKPWRFGTASGSFVSDSGASFRVEEVPAPFGGGGGQYPATGKRCAGTFQVLHDDRIGSFRVPAGPYAVTLLSSGTLSCQSAMNRFAGFLQDYDGKLASPWILDAHTATFLRGSTTTGFRVKPASSKTGGGGGSTSDAGKRCPGTFRVLHDDRIGALRLPKGNYVITLSAGKPVGCSASATDLARFLDDPDGDLPTPWRLKTSTATFSKGNVSAFRIKAAA